MTLHRKRLQMADPDTIGGRVRIARIQCGWTQQQLADAAAQTLWPSGKFTLSKSMVSKIEQNDNHPSLPVFVAIAHALGAGLVWLLDGEGSYTARDTGSVVTVEFHCADAKPDRAAASIERHLRPAIERLMTRDGLGRLVTGPPRIRSAPAVRPLTGPRP